MRQHDSQTAHELEDAFKVFNQLSEQLATAYHVLENRVAHLGQELAAANSERIVQLAEKERLANRLERLLAALPAGVVVVDGGGRIQECNPAAVALLGSELAGDMWESVAERMFIKDTADGREVTLRNGRRITLSVRPLGSEPGQILLLTDVTETRALQQAVDRHRRLSAMGEMVASLAHQVRTPLSAAILYTSQLAGGRTSGEDTLRISGKVMDRLRHLDQMVNDMLAFARGETLETEQISTTDLFSALLHGLEPMFEQAGAHLEIKEPATAVVFHGNRETLLSALQNLAMNSLQAGGSGVAVEVAAEVDGDHLVLTVADDGSGILPQVADRIFEPFFTTRPDGTGLGLAVVRSVVAAHNGSVQLVERSEQGACFQIALPLDSERHWLPSGAFVQSESRHAGGAAQKNGVQATQQSEVA